MRVHPPPRLLCCSVELVSYITPLVHMLFLSLCIIFKINIIIKYLVVKQLNSANQVTNKYQRTQSIARQQNMIIANYIANTNKVATIKTKHNQLAIIITTNFIKHTEKEYSKKSKLLMVLKIIRLQNYVCISIYFYYNYFTANPPPQVALLFC